MAYTTADLERVEAAIKSGHKRVKFRDRDVTFHDLDDLRALKRDIENDLNRQAGGKTVRRMVGRPTSGL